MKKLVKFLVVSVMFCIFSITIFAKEIDITNKKDVPITVTLYYRGEYLDTFIIPPGVTKTYDIGDSYCKQYSFSYISKRTPSYQTPRKEPFYPECSETVY